MVQLLLDLRTLAEDTINTCFVDSTFSPDEATAASVPNSPSSSTTSRARNKSTVVATSATPTSPTASTRFKAHRSKPAEMIARYLDKAMQKGQGAQSTKEYERTLDKAVGEEVVDWEECELGCGAENGYDPKFDLGESMFNDLKLLEDLMREYPVWEDKTKKDELKAKYKKLEQDKQKKNKDIDVDKIEDALAYDGGTQCLAFQRPEEEIILSLALGFGTQVAIPTSAIHTPIALFPTPFPCVQFEQASTYNTLYARIALETEFLDEVMGVGKVDDFVGKLWTGWKALRDKGLQQIAMFQYVFNTISSSFSTLSQKVSEMHRHVHLCASTGFYDSSPYLQADNLPPNDTIAGPVEGLAAAHTAYDVPRYVSLLNICLLLSLSCTQILFIVQPGERNVFDQLWLEYELLEKHSIKVIRLTFDELSSCASVSSINAPLFTTSSSLHFPPGASPSSKFPLSTSAQPTPPPTSPPHPTTSTLKSLATQLHRHPYGLPPSPSRMELIAQNKLNDVMEVGVTRFHFSIQENNQLPLNFTHEYQAANRYSLHQPNPIPSWFRRACLENPRPLPDFTPSTWHNFVVQVDWDQRTLQVFYSTDGETLEAVTDVVQICQMRVLGVSAGAGIQVTHAQQDQDQI
ncbi:hypothetical protein D9758_018828 [Tetrapyrgos nigripes]|uniref:Glycoside hydrolase 131 catalytic N-terminal domain-containing protein n=1 Tax=Tetrapyrgos nigripes TaxID=182062 RepID=A0A8H5B7Y4_9AGAR|nr:hypothetical protein D9758_018828 [Tetrapyrgos nigripes]